MTYLETTAKFYAEAAETPRVGLCCVSSPLIQLPGLNVLDDQAGHILQREIPLAICDKTAAKLALQFPQDVIITDSTWHYNSGGCCERNS